MRGLNKIYYIKIEIEQIENEIKNLPIISSPQYTGMPHSTGVSNPIEAFYLKRENLIEKLNKKKARLQDEIDRIEDIIDRIEDAEVRSIARYRYIDNMKWEDIAQEVHYDRTVCYRKLKGYFNKMNERL